MTAIEFHGVSKSFPRHGGRVLMRHGLMRILQRAQRERFFALKNISFEVPEGDGLAVIGPNGAGKSTVLSLLAGLAEPDSGTIRVRGRVAPLLELGSGFHPDLTGAENVFINASLLGLSRRRTSELYEEIVEFSGIREFMREPLRTYSAGMTMRLAFSVAINMDPEILLIDELLAVGDRAFQEKCKERVRSFRRTGKTFVCVSHAAGMLDELCNQAIWLDHGQIVMSGKLADVAGAYEGRRPVATAPATPAVSGHP
ncbi:MAG: ABC transporter ATP-binding protein [Bryobacteraceae bacterium]